MNEHLGCCTHRRRGHPAAHARRPIRCPLPASDNPPPKHARPETRSGRHRPARRTRTGPTNPSLRPHSGARAATTPRLTPRTSPAYYLPGVLPPSSLPSLHHASSIVIEGESLPEGKRDQLSELRTRNFTPREMPYGNNVTSGHSTHNNTTEFVVLADKRRLTRERPPRHGRDEVR